MTQLKTLKTENMYFQHFSDCPWNDWKWQEMFGKGCTMAESDSKWLEMTGKSWKRQYMPCKLIKMTGKSWIWMEMAVYV